MEWMLQQLNTIGGAFVEFASLMLIESAVLMGLVLLVEYVFRHKVRAALRYWLVVLVLAYLLLTPFLPTWPPSNFLPSGNAAYADPTTHLAAEHLRAPLSRPTTGQSQTTSAGIGEPPHLLTWQGGAFLLWLAGVAVMSGVLVRRTALACRHVERAPDANFLMTDILQYCRKRMGIKGKVALRISEEGTRPVVCGLLRPVIVVPRNLVPTLGSRHLRDVLFHELAHIKRRDLWVNLIQNIGHVLYFFNPFLWVAGAVLRRLRDEAADETVRGTIGNEDPSYAQRLADVARLPLLRPATDLEMLGVA
ncbi:MAG: M56 family metallopeptidase [Phycisphaerales bacterium]|nr:MAG: M56 family metallopeptidase [Phycisphaerales bacterium]